MRFAVVHPLPEVRVRLTHSRKAYLRVLRRHDAMPDDIEALLEGSEALTNSFDVPGVGLCNVVYMRPDLGRDAAEDAGLLAHEATHVMQAYMDCIAEREPGDEMQAYVTGSVTTQLVTDHFRWKQRQIDKRDGKGR